jgi:hypothetical protein
LWTKNEATIIGKDIEDLLTEYIPNYLKLLKTIGVIPPILIMIGLLRVSQYKIGYTIGPRSGRIITDYDGGLPFQGISQNTVILPEVILRDYEDNLAILLHPVITAIWNAGGFAKSPHRKT